MTDFPFNEVTDTVTKLLLSNPEAKVFQKYTCKGCGSRLTMDIPNTFYASGTCDNCPTVTNIKEQGCNYMVVLGDAINGTSEETKSN